MRFLLYSIKRPVPGLFFLLLGTNSFAINSDRSMSVNPGNDVSIENKVLKVTFHKASGTLDVFDKTKKILAFKNAMFRFDRYASTDAGLNFACLKLKNNELKITGAYKSGIKICLDIVLSEHSTAAIFTPEIKNDSNESLIVKEISVIDSALIYPDLRLCNIQLLDGNGGGEVTHVRNELSCNSRNNLLLTGLAGGRRVAFTIGGLSYDYFEKFAGVDQVVSRRDVLAAQVSHLGQKMVGYFHLGKEDQSTSSDVVKLKVEEGKPYQINAHSIPELNQVIYNKNEVVISTEALDPAKAYNLGFSWFEESSKRNENVSVADADRPYKRYRLLSNQILPSASKLDSAEQRFYNIPKEAYRSGRMKIFFENANNAENAIVSEIWIDEGKVSAPGLVTKVKPLEVNNLSARLYAKDPIGKLLMPGESFNAEKDRFYIDVITADPFKSLENYAFALKDEQKINIRHYTFPTVCLWYASHADYGGNESGAAVNDSKGAVDEMNEIAKSGFLKYSTASVRLVPDSYLSSNEQGWWDETHWQKYGHYKKPYETTAKWAGAVTKLGGIPLTYFQTGVRSQDYADTFPQYMLFNEANVPEHNYYPNPNKNTYDFTDAGFIRHMKEVYANLRNGGVQGLMFDYPETGWGDYGGFEDKTKTTAWAYRNIFKLAHDGLNGDSSLVHERNLSRGSDVTLGAVASQRVWGDTDGMTPEMMTRSGLRWYKNRVVVSYDTDSKNLAKFMKVSRDKLRQALTMAYVTTGRLLLGNSFKQLSTDEVHDLSRIFPFHNNLQSARPIDAFINYYPSVYDYKVSDDWHLVTLYNTEENRKKEFLVKLSAENVDGGLQLNPTKNYYFYDFWNERFMGKLSGNSVLNQTLRKDEARMIAVHEVQKNPQFISTNRHIMQGYLDLANVKWDASANSYMGIAKVIGGEPFKMIIAANGLSPLQAITKSENVEINITPNKIADLYEVEIKSSVNRSVDWEINFSKQK